MPLFTCDLKETQQGTQQHTFTRFSQIFSYLFIYLFKVFIGLWWAKMNERHRPTHHPLDAHYYSIVDELQLS